MENKKNEIKGDEEQTKSFYVWIGSAWRHISFAELCMCIGIWRRRRWRQQQRTIDQNEDENDGDGKARAIFRYFPFDLYQHFSWSGIRVDDASVCNLYESIFGNDLNSTRHLCQLMENLWLEIIHGMTPLPLRIAATLILHTLHKPWTEPKLNALLSCAHNH